MVIPACFGRQAVSHELEAGLVAHRQTPGER
jgi:hypothetical protein